VNVLLPTIGSAGDVHPMIALGPSATSPSARCCPRAALLVYHGGIGTMAQAIKAAIPHLVVPNGEGDSMMVREQTPHWMAR
jgi:UDP:flavonoid glycosyltransferase YjiC (YdhE family)